MDGARVRVGAQPAGPDAAHRAGALALALIVGTARPPGATHVQLTPVLRQTSRPRSGMDAQAPVRRPDLECRRGPSGHAVRVRCFGRALAGRQDASPGHERTPHEMNRRGCLVAALAALSWVHARAQSDSPAELRLRAELDSFAASVGRQPPPAGGVLFVVSSSSRLLTPVKRARAATRPP